MLNRFTAWKARASWLDMFVANMLLWANQDACDKLPRELFLAAERDLDRMVNDWLIDRWDA